VTLVSFRIYATVTITTPCEATPPEKAPVNVPRSLISRKERRQDFDRYITLQYRITGTVHFAHAPAPRVPRIS